MGFVELAPPGEVMISSPDQKSFHAYNSNKPETKTVVFRVDTAPHGAETPTPLADANWLGFVKPPAIGEYTYNPILGTKQPPYIYDSNSSETTAVISADDTAPHGGETPTTGTPLSTGVHEAGDLHPLGARRFSKFIYHDVIDVLLIVK